MRNPQRTSARGPPGRQGARAPACPGPLAVLLSFLLCAAALLAPARASQVLLHAAANHAAEHPRARARGAAARHAAVDWTIYHRTDALLARVRALAASCPYALPQLLALADDGGTQHELLVVTLAAGAADRRQKDGDEEDVQADHSRGAPATPGALAAAVDGEPVPPPIQVPNEPKISPESRGWGQAAMKFSASGNGSNPKRAAAAGRTGSDSQWPGRSPVAERRARVLAVFGEHGRELVSAEVALKLVERVCSPPKDRTEETAREEMLRELERTELVLIPVISPQGRKMAEEGRSCERLNARGVDVNRNFGHEWGRTDNSTLKTEERSGRAPFSEFESRAAHVLALHIRPHAYISVHAGGRAIVTPWDSTGKAPDERAIRDDLARVAELLVGTHCPDCRIGTAKSLFGYCAYGTGVDFMHSILRVPIALTWEIFGDPNAPEEDCVRFFNPVTRDEFARTVDTWSRAFQTLSMSLHSLGSVKTAPRKSSVLEDGLAFVASRLGHSSWTPSMYRASLKTDHYAAPVPHEAQLQTARDSQRAPGLSFDGMADDPNHALLMMGAIMTVVGFLAVAHTMRRFLMFQSNDSMQSTSFAERIDMYGVRPSATTASGSALFRRTGRLIGSLMPNNRRELGPGGSTQGGTPNKLA